MKYSYSISRFSWLPQALDKELINQLSRKVSYASMIFYPDINGFRTNGVKIHLYICDNSIVTFGISGLCLGFSNTSQVDSLYRLRKSVFDKIKTDVYIIK